MIARWVRLARPAMLPYLWALVLAGFGFAHWDFAAPLSGIAALPWVLAAWACLHAGSLWWNAALDRDQGAVLFGAPAEVPRGAGFAGAGATALGLVFSTFAGTDAFVAAAACAALSAAYSVPPLAWKRHPVGGPVVNLLGYGVLTPWAGHAIVGVPVTARAAATVGVAASGVLAVYFVAQSFQGDEDRARGDRTWVAVYGASATVQAARVCAAAAVCGAALLAAVGWYPRALLLLLPVYVWVEHAFVAQARCADVRGAVRIVRRFGATALLALVLAFADYAVQSFGGAPVAGAGTVAGRPGLGPAR